MLITMSIKILLISSDDSLLHKFETVYESHIEHGFFQIYSPKSIESSSSKISYDVIITEEEYLSLISLKHLPIIIISKDESAPTNENDKYIYISTPIDWQNLYDTILSLQYRSRNTNLFAIPTPAVEKIMESNEGTALQLNKEQQQEEQANEDKNHNHTVSTKLYNKDDMNRVDKILNNYATQNSINEKVMAQAGIILDELIYTINNLQNITNNNEPKLMINMINNDHEFHLNVECLVPLGDNINNILSVAQDYANTVQSFKRNNSYFLNLQWYV